MRRTLALIALITLAAGCRKTSPPNEPTDADRAERVEADGDGPSPVVADPDPDPDPDGSKVGGLPGPTLPEGRLCDTHADCGEGMQCEGVGCEPGQGRCVRTDRMCTRDLAQYCGCDGEQFAGSGTCPGDRYAYRGPCNPKREDGEACIDGRQCKSGMCVGEGLEGCSRDDQGVCGAIACTEDRAIYCGCNNTQFAASGSCPNQQFAHRGPCEGL